MVMRNLVFQKDILLIPFSVVTKNIVSESDARELFKMLEVLLILLAHLTQPLVKQFLSRMLHLFVSFRSRALL